MIADENWGNAPIGAGPYSLTYDPESGLTELTRVDLVGQHWNGPNDRPVIEKLMLPNIEDEQARLFMFENGELDVMSIGRESFAAALDPDHPFYPLVYESPDRGLWYIDMAMFWMAPMEDPNVRKALARGVDMEKIVRGVWGPAATHAKGLMSSSIPCHNPDADYQAYAPDIARQLLSESTYGDASILPPLKIDLHQPDMVTMGVAMKEHWKDNLGVNLDILKREIGEFRREGAQLYRRSMGPSIPDLSEIVDKLTLKDTAGPARSIPGGYPVLATLAEYVRSLPLDDPDRCTALQAFEEYYLDKVYIIPIRGFDPIRWVVQPWLRGFESSFNQDFNTLTTAYVVRH